LLSPGLLATALNSTAAAAAAACAYTAHLLPVVSSAAAMSSTTLSDIVGDGATLQELEELQAQLYSIILQRFGPAAAAGVSRRGQGQQHATNDGHLWCIRICSSGILAQTVWSSCFHDLQSAPAVSCNLVFTTPGHQQQVSTATAVATAGAGSTERLVQA
jgi:hypothetical protein